MPVRQTIIYKRQRQITRIELWTGHQGLQVHHRGKRLNVGGLCDHAKPCFGIEAGWSAAGSLDTVLSFLSFLELYRTNVAKRRMAPGRVLKPLDVIEYVSTGLLPDPAYLVALR